MWKVSSCKAIDYPRFTQEEITNNLQPFSDKHKTFSGHIAYTTDVDIPTEWIEAVNRGKKVYVNIENAGEDVELFWNGQSLGIQVLAPFCFDVTRYLSKVKNSLYIEVASGLERERKVNKKSHEKTGITGNVVVQLISEPM